MSRSPRRSCWQMALFTALATAAIGPAAADTTSFFDQYSNPPNTTDSNPTGNTFAPTNPGTSNFSNAGTYNNSGYTYTLGLSNAGFTNSGTFNNLGASSSLGMTHGTNAAGALLSNAGLLGLNYVLLPGTGENVSVNSSPMLFTNSGVLDNSGTIINAGNLTNGATGTITIRSGASLSSAYNSQHGLDTQNIVPTDPSLYAAQIQNLGTLTNNGLLTNGSAADAAVGVHSSTLVNSGTFVNDAQGAPGPTSGNLQNWDSFENHGLVQNVNGAQITNHGTFVNVGGATLDNGGSFSTAGGSTLTNGGQLNDTGSLSVERLAQFTNNSIVSVSNGGQLAVHGQFDNNSVVSVASNLSTLSIDGTLNDNVRLTIVQGSLVNAGQLNIAQFGFLQNNGTFLNGGTVRDAGTLLNSGTLTNVIDLEITGITASLSNTGSLQMDGSVISSLGSISNSGLIGMDANAVINNRTGATLANAGGVITVDGTIANDGTVQNDGQLTVTANGRLTGGGTYIQSSGTTTVAGGMSQSQILVQGGALAGAGTISGEVHNSAGGTLALTGLINGNVFNEGGTIAPDGTAALTINGALHFSDGLLDIKIDGPGVLNQLLVSGFGEFTGGTLEFDFSDGFAPARDQLFDFARFGELGAFDPTNLLFTGVPDGYQFEAFANGNDLDLEVLDTPVKAVPEPDMPWLLSPALLILALASRRARRSARAPVGGACNDLTF